MRVSSRLFPALPCPVTAFVLILCACAAAPLRAASGPVDDLTTVPFEQLLSMQVYSASRFAQRASEAPSSVTVISAADIRSYGWRTLADVARSVRGMHVSYDRNYSYLGGRGFLRPGDYNTRFLLQVNGNRINDAVYDQAPLGGEFPLELDLIERIEFVPGPGSSVYGSNAFFGVINVITKTAGDPSASRISIEGGQFGARKAAASAAWRSAGGTRMLLAASRQLSAGEDQYYPEFDTPAQNHGLAQALDYERATRLFASATHGPFSLTLMHADRVKGIPTASFLQPFNDPRPRTTDSQAYVALAYRDALGAREQLSAQVLHGHYDSVGDYVYDDAARTLNHDGSQARWWGAEANIVSTRFPGHKIVAGFDFQRDYRLRQYSFDVAPFYSKLHDVRRASRAGLYLQDEVAFGDRVLLNLGLRHDEHTGAAGVTSPRVALIFQVAPATTFKAIHGAAFRAPNSYEKHYAFPGEGGQLANPSLRKERIDSSEAVLMHEMNDNARLTATAYRNKVGGLITLLSDEQTQITRFENAGRTSAHGVELEYERHWLSGASLRTSYSHVRLSQVADAASNPVRANSPVHLAKLNLAMPLGWRGWHAGLETQYTGPRTTLTGSTGGYWLANLNLATTRLLRNVEMSVSLFNLFDRRYADPGSAEHVQAAIAQDGRSARVKLVYVF
jgi:outer membrane cobalamin receptor